MGKLHSQATLKKRAFSEDDSKESSNKAAKSVDQKQSDEGDRYKVKKKPTGVVVKDHPSNKRTGCGNKMEWQEKSDLPACSKEVCAFAKRPDYSKSSDWASSLIGKAYAESLKGKNGKPAFQLRQGKRLLRDDKGKVASPVKLIDNDKASLDFDYKDVKKLLRSSLSSRD